MPLTQETFAALVLEDTDGRWEIHRQRLREKPSTSFTHNRFARGLTRHLNAVLPVDFEVLAHAGHLALPDGGSYIPDVGVLPPDVAAVFEPDGRRFERYVQPLPLVVEVWSPSTATYDVDAKIPGYMARGEFEIWRVHPFERRVTAWRRRDDGGYDEMTFLGGTVELAALPGIVVDIDLLFE